MACLIFVEKKPKNQSARYQAQDLFCSRQAGMHVYAGVKRNPLTSERLAYRL